MKKILFILHYPPPIHGAAMVGDQIRKSHHINSTFNCEYINLSTSITVDEIGQKGIQKWLRYFTIIKTTISKSKKLRPDLTYVTLTAKGIGFYKDALIVIILKLLGFKTVFHFHNKGISDYQNKWFDHLLYKIVFKNSNVILLSKHLYYDVEKYVTREDVYYCPNGIVNHTPIIKKSTKSDCVQLLFLSNLLLSKGIFIVLEACKKLKSEGLHFHCTIVGGEGDITSKMLEEKINEMDIDNFVSYKGKKYGKDKEKIYAESDIFVFPTFYHNETFGLVNLEAMQFSLPVISTREGGIPEVVLHGKTGYLIPKKNPDALAEKLKTLIENPKLRKEMGRNGRIHFEQNFTQELFEHRFCNILKEIA